MKHILFVDDEKKILDGIQRMLRSMRKQWHMVFAPGGEEAILELQKQPFDVVVTDMRMPKVDGAALLTHVQKNYPSIVRIVLSGYAELEATLRTIPVAHQYLSKPCDPEHLKSIIERACSLQNLLNSPIIQKIAGEIGGLPSLPATYSELNRELVKEDCSLAKMGKIVKKDMAVCAKILQVVNSAFFGIPRQISAIEDAVNLLGTNLLKNLVLSVEVFQGFEKNVRAFSLERLQNHAFLAANISRNLLTNKKESEDAFTATLLHDIGELILASKLPEEFSRILEEGAQSRRPIHIVEKEQLGITHAELGAYLLGLWGLPYPIVEAVAYHHSPSSVQQTEMDVLGAVYVGNLLAHEFSAHPFSGKTYDPLDLEYLETIGADENLSKWRTMAETLANGTEE